MLSKYDKVLANHIDKAYKLSTLQNEFYLLNKSSNKKGRGRFVTFLTANTVSKVIKEIQKQIKEMIAQDIKKSFSVLMAITMDVSSYDQYVIVLRYLTNHQICERVLALEHVPTSGESLFESLKSNLEELNIPMNFCVENPFDRAANMNGHYKGVSERLEETVPNHVYTWCYARVLNLVVTDASQCLTETISFFSLL